MVFTSLLPLYANLAIFYIGLLLGGGFVLRGLKNSSQGYKGLVILALWVAAVNYRYGIKEIGPTIAFFNSVYDPWYNIGASGNLTQYPGLARCDNANNDCSLLSYEFHASWAVTFHRRFTSAVGASVNRARLYSHIWMNTTALLLCLVQFHGPTREKYVWLHRKLGWVAIALVVGGTMSGLLLGLGHGAEDDYGNFMAVGGWISMAGTIFSTLLLGVVAILRKDVETHRKWMIRFYGSMWGAFLVFRIVFLAGGFFRWHRFLMIQISIWSGAPLGVACAEFWRVRQVKPLAGKGH